MQLQQQREGEQEQVADKTSARGQILLRQIVGAVAACSWFPQRAPRTRRPTPPPRSAAVPCSPGDPTRPWSAPRSCSACWQRAFRPHAGSASRA
jgi:hypothetical protein